MTFIPTADELAEAHRFFEDLDNHLAAGVIATDTWDEYVHGYAYMMRENRAREAARADVGLPVTPDGEMPAPFPGMWILDTADTTSAVLSYIRIQGEWYFGTHDDPVCESEVVAVLDHDGRELWRRA